MTFTGNRTHIAHMVAQWFTQHATAAITICYVGLNTHTKIIEAEKMVIKMEKDCKMNNVVYGKTKVNLRKNWYKTCKEQKRLFKMSIKTKLHVTENIIMNQSQ